MIIRAKARNFGNEHFSVFVKDKSILTGIRVVGKGSRKEREVGKF